MNNPIPVQELSEERDIYEVANQLQGYVGPSTPSDLSAFLMREGAAAGVLADEIVRLRALVTELQHSRAAPTVAENVTVAPEGWALVPRDLTDGMAEAGNEFINWGGNGVHQVWDAIIAYVETREAPFGPTDPQWSGAATRKDVGAPLASPASPSATGVRVTVRPLEWERVTEEQP